MSGAVDPVLQAEFYHKEENSDFADLESIHSRLLMRQAEEWLAGQGCTWWLEDYRALRSSGWKWKDALSITWLSLRRDDRGEMRTKADLCNWLGVSERWIYSRRAKFDNQPGPGMNLWDVTAERLQLRRLRGARLAEVDERTYEAAASAEGTAKDRDLYYKRADVYGKVRHEISGLEDEPLTIVIERMADGAESTVVPTAA